MTLRSVANTNTPYKVWEVFWNGAAVCTTKAPIFTGKNMDMNHPKCLSCIHYAEREMQHPRFDLEYAVPYDWCTHRDFDIDDPSTFYCADHNPGKTLEITNKVQS